MDTFVKSVPPATPSSSSHQIKESDVYREVDLKEVFTALGGDSNQDGDAQKWKLHGVNFITIGQRWQHTLDPSLKGYGGINLVGWALGLETRKDFRKVMDWFREHFGSAAEIDPLKVASHRKDEPHLFAPPQRSVAATTEARRYLNQVRCLPLSLIDREISTGKLYGAHPEKNGKPIHQFSNCIFLGPASAEVRSTVDTEEGKFSGCLGGSLPQYSGYRVAPLQSFREPVLALTEAAIDALSYHVLYPGRFTVSMNGSGTRLPLEYGLMVEAVDNQYKVLAAFDADAAGDITSQRLADALLARKVVSHMLKIEEEDFDEMVLDEVVTFPENRSPHHMAFATGAKEYRADWPVMKLSDPEDYQSPLVPTGAVSPPALTIHFKRAVGRFPVGDWTYVLPEKAWDYIHRLLIRDRPPQLYKDWNKQLKESPPQVLEQYRQAVLEDALASATPTKPQP